MGGQFCSRHEAPIVSGEIRQCGSVACAGRNAALFLAAAARGKRPDTEMVRAAIRPSYQRSQGAIAKQGRTEGRGGVVWVCWPLGTCLSPDSAPVPLPTATGGQALAALAAPGQPT